jgi:hypothetical protein
MQYLQNFNILVLVGYGRMSEKTLYNFSFPNIKGINFISCNIDDHLLRFFVHTENLHHFQINDCHFAALISPSMKGYYLNMITVFTICESALDDKNCFFFPMNYFKSIQLFGNGRRVATREAENDGEFDEDEDIMAGNDDKMIKMIRR